MHDPVYGLPRAHVLLGIRVDKALPYDALRLRLREVLGGLLGPPDVPPPDRRCGYSGPPPSRLHGAPRSRTDRRSSLAYRNSGLRTRVPGVTVLARWYGLAVLPVQPTLVLVEPGPASGPGVLVRVHGPRLRLAPDALVPLVEERVDGHVVLLDVIPHLLVGPVGERRDLGGPVALLPGDNPRVRPLRGLIPADAGHPGHVPAQSPLQGLDLAYPAAQVWGAGAHLLAVALDLLLDGERRSQHLERQLVAPHDLLAELRGLPEDEACVDREDRDLVGDLGDHVHGRHPLAAPERRREGQTGAVGVDRPLDYLPRVCSLQMPGQALEGLGVR